VWVPNEGSEALRDLVRAREAVKQDQLRVRHRLSKFLLCSGQARVSVHRLKSGRGRGPYRIWVAQLRLTQMSTRSGLR
jgi:transposase